MISTYDAPVVKTRRRLIGVAFLAILALLIWLSVAIYQKQFVSADTVKLETSSVGNEMHTNADVKLRGVVIGQVRKIQASGQGATLTLALQPGQIGRLPENVTAQMLPTTLFGQRYVALIPPADASPAPLKAGMTITEDRTSNAVELQQVLDNTLPLLTAVEPAKLSATLTALAQALSGKGGELGQALVRLDDYLKKTNPTLPQLTDDIHQLVTVAQDYAQGVPDILQALTDFSTTSRTIVNQRGNLGDLYSQVTTDARVITAWLEANEGNIIQLSADSRPSLEVIGKYAPEFPCTLQMLAGFVPAIDKALGKGTNEHGLHVTVKVVPATGKYVPGRDRPRNDDTPDIGPHCYSVPYTGAFKDEALGRTGAEAPAAQPALGLVNSSGENQLVNEIVGAASGRTPAALPDWSSVLVGGLYRGTEVGLR